MGNWNTENYQHYVNVRLSRDAKHFPAKGEKGAVTFLSFYHGTKGGEDIPVDVHVRRGAELAGGYKKGDVVSVRGPLHFKKDDRGLKAVLYADQVTSQVNLKERASEIAAESGGTAVPPECQEAEDDGNDAFA